MNNIGNNLLKEAKNYVDTIIWNGRNLEINWKEEISYKEVSLTKRKFLYDFLVKKLVEILKIKGIKVLGIDYINFQISCLKKTSAKHSKIKNSETIYNQTLEIVDIVEKEYNKNEENIKLIDKIDMALYQLLKEEKIADNVLVRALFETQKRLQGTPDPSYGDYDNEFYDKKTFLQVFDEQFETQIENLDFPDKVDILKKNATELGLHISKGEVVEFYDEEWEDYDLDEINDFIVEKITPIVKEKLEAVIENDNEKEGMIFKPVIDEFKDNTRNEFIDFDNVISKFRTVLEKDLKNNKEKEKEEEFEK